jgi:mannosyltransferase
VAVAAALRWYAIGRSSVWIDEGASITLARMPWHRFLRVVSQYEANMAAYYLLLRAWLPLGDSEAVVRSLSALLGTMAVVAVFLLGRRLFGDRVGLLGAALLSVNMFHLWFSQEARGYGLAVLLVTCSLLLFVEAIERPERRWTWVGYIAASVVAVYAHVFAALVLAAQWLAVGPRRLRDIGPRRLAFILVGLGLPLTPLALFMLRRDRGQIEWIPPLSAGSLVAGLLGPCGFNGLMLLLVLIGLAWGLKSLTGKDDAAFRMRLLALAFSFPLVATALASIVKPVFFFRYFAICIPPATLLAARVLSPVRALTRVKRALVGALAILTLGLSALVTVGYYVRMPNWAGDWRGATAYVLAHRAPGDAILFHVSAGRDAYAYYEDRLPSDPSPVPLPVVVFPRAGDLASIHLVPEYDSLRTAGAGHPRLWAVLHQKKATDLPAPFLAAYRKVDEKVFPGVDPSMSVTVELYQVRPTSDVGSAEDASVE